MISKHFFPNGVSVENNNNDNIQLKIMQQKHLKIIELL